MWLMHTDDFAQLVWRLRALGNEEAAVEAVRALVEALECGVDGEVIRAQICGAGSGAPGVPLVAAGGCEDVEHLQAAEPRAPFAGG